MSDDVFLTRWKDNANYFSTLQMLAGLSRLFSESEIPYLDYRLAENVFCAFYNAKNRARNCDAFDAKLGTLGIGIKTFILKNNRSTEKVAEFDKCKSELDLLSGIDLARKLAYLRNERINFASNACNATNHIYHVVGRNQGFLRIFNTKYDLIDSDNIEISKNCKNTFSFNDGTNEYSFNRSKSTLSKLFVVPASDYYDVPIQILNDPLTTLFELLNKNKLNKEIVLSTTQNGVKPSNNFLFFNCGQKGFDYVILPLYSERGGVQIVPTKSGLNQWNAGGRKRNCNEVYIPIPAKIHQDYPDFFPKRDEHFTLLLPDGKKLTAKVCQDNGKALMSAHNADLGEWLLRRVLQKKEGELVTIDDLNIFGIDSVRVNNEHATDNDGMKLYSIEFTVDKYESYSNFFEE